MSTIVALLIFDLVKSCVCVFINALSDKFGYYPDLDLQFFILGIQGILYQSTFV